MTESNVTALRPLDESEALSWLRAQPGGRISARPGELGRRWRWHHRTVSGKLNAWARDGIITRRRNSITVLDLSPSETPLKDTKLPEFLGVKPAPSIAGEALERLSFPAFRRGV
jgi:hypothetical protein